MKQVFIRKWPFLWKLRLVWIAAVLLIFVVFLYLKILPAGRAVYHREYPNGFSFGKGFIYNFTPEERVVKNKDGPFLIIGDPVYFSVYTPRTFDKARLTVFYRDNLKINTPVIEAGVLADKLVWRYNLQPLSNKSLDYLGILWDKIEDNGLWILQKEKNYSNLLDLENDLQGGHLKNCPYEAHKCLAVYNYIPNYAYRPANYERPLPISLEESLRGPHQFYTYLHEGPLYIDLSFDYLRQSDKLSPIEIMLSSAKEIITTRRLEDDGRLSVGNKNEFLTVTIEEKNLPAGLYKVDIKSSDDVLIKKIYSSTGKIAFINKLWLAGREFSGSKEVYTDGPFLQVKIIDPASRQKIIFGDQEFYLSDAYTQQDLESSAGGALKKIVLEKDGIILENNGVFVFDANSFFNPQLQKVDRFFSVHSAPPYIIARYNKPQENEGIKTATAEFYLKGVYRENGRYNFMISVPGLKAEDEANDNLEILSLKLEFSGRTIWQKLGDYLH